MRLPLLFIGLGAMTAMAGTIQHRQNDVPHCIDGLAGTNDGLFTSPGCENKCYYKENADGDNKNGVCAGPCVEYIPPPNGPGGLELGGTGLTNSK
ncbi:hypothetical protein DL98DRAFT_588868 [Cadophora sp. DSE1049]|nr:hypothetical protein DL98DRAFT_588868 [Cadophora sp. DSE1049]